MATQARSSRAKSNGYGSSLPIEPLWYKDAVIYQLHVRSFFDSDGDGIGDFAGLTQKLDYLQDLGVTALWLLPFYPSPLRDDGYDIASYTDVNPSYGTLRDFKNFVREAHHRGLRVITELVINHTSDQHPWFQRARQAKPGSPDRDFYVWSDTPEKYQDARIIFKDFEASNWAWDPVAKAYYWHRFYSHQPDLNFDNPRVRKAVFEVLDYWLRMGVDGLRLDAVPYLFEREGTNCENLPETHAFLKDLRRHVDEQFPNRMLLAEANQWPEDAIAYFGDGDECHTAFHFPVMPRLFMSIHMEDRFPIVDILQQTPPIPPESQWLIFLRNHDELTLEMVTDEERDYMYRVYARDRQARINLGIRRRLAPLLGNNRRKIELMNGLLCSLPGTPVIYYGDEIGMGDNIYLGDRHGVRTPMQWSPDRNAGFSSANPQRLYSPVIVDPEYLYETINVENQQKNPHSLLWWMKRLISLRQHNSALQRGSIELLTPENSKILAFTRDHQEQSVLMVANLSRFVQYVELDLSRFAGIRPIELFGQTPFPMITRAPYVLTLAPHAFYWFGLERERIEIAGGTDESELPRLAAGGQWPDFQQGRMKRSFESSLRRELERRRWFGPRKRTLQGLQLVDLVPLGKPTARSAPALAKLRAAFVDGEPETYILPLGTALGAESETLLDTAPASRLAQLQKPNSKDTGWLYDATLDPATASVLLATMAHRRRYKGSQGELTGWAAPGLASEADHVAELRAVPTRAEQRTDAVVFGDRYIFKPFRRVEPGVNPDLEIGRFLCGERVRYPHVLPVVGALEYRNEADEAFTIGVLHEYVPNTVTAWQFAQDAIGRFLEQVLTHSPETRPTVPAGERSLLWQLAAGPAPPLAKDLLGSVLEWANLLGRRTGELHRALASERGNPDFSPEPFTQLYQRSLYQSSRKAALQTLAQLRQALPSLSAEAQNVGQAALAAEKAVLESLRGIVGQKADAQRIRCHGDFHLGHVLYTGKDFLVIDFEGDPSLSLSARRIKQSALDDVAGMIHAFYYASAFALSRWPAGATTPEAEASLRQGAQFWYLWTSSAFLRGYASVVEGTGLIPASPQAAESLLQFLLLDKAISGLQSELNDSAERVSWLAQRIVDLAAS